MGIEEFEVGFEVISMIAEKTSYKDK